MKKFLIRIYDIIIAIIIFFTKWVFINFRKRGPENLPITSKFLKKSGFYHQTLMILNLNTLTMKEISI